MSDNNSPDKDVPFCKRSWKAPAVIMGLACLATFAWGFHILQDYAISKRLYGHDGAGLMSSLRVVGVGAKVMDKLNSFNRSAVVNIAGLRGDGAPGAAGQVTSAGSGVIVNPSGYVVTALHIISGLDNIVVRAMTPAGMKTYDAQIVKRSPSHDLVMIKIISRDIFPFMTLGDSQALQVGQQVYAFGDPQGADLIVKQGVIQNLGLNVAIGDIALTNMIHTDAVYIWGQTGGPLVNRKGQMIGLNITATNSNGQTIGYTIPSHIIVSHFQDVVQFLTSIDKTGSASVALPAPGNTRNMNMAANPPEMEMRRNAMAARRRSMAARRGWAGEAGGAAGGGWWKKARVFLDRQSGSVAGAPYAMKINTVLTTGQKQLKDTAHSPGWTLWGYPLYSVAGLLLLGFVSGISGGMMTMGGGIIKVTGLMLFFGYGILLVRPVAYITNIFIYGAASIRYNDGGLIAWDNVRPLVPWAMAGIVIGYFVGNGLEMETIRYLLGVFALWIAFKILSEIFESNKKTGDQGKQFAGIGDNEPPAKDVGEDGYISNDLLRNGVLGFPMGIISGILGISGGVIEVPLQRYLANAPLKNAIANSAVMVLCASTAGSVVAMAHGLSVGAFEWETPLALAAILVPGAYLGGMAGAWLTRVAPINILRWVYVTLMFAIAVRIFLP